MVKNRLNVIHVSLLHHMRAVNGFTEYAVFYDLVWKNISNQTCARDRREAKQLVAIQCLITVTAHPPALF